MQQSILDVFWLSGIVQSRVLGSKHTGKILLVLQTQAVVEQSSLDLRVSLGKMKNMTGMEVQLAEVVQVLQLATIPKWCGVALTRWEAHTL